jgi:hypothetical protein
MKVRNSLTIVAMIVLFLAMALARNTTNGQPAHDQIRATVDKAILVL